MIERLVARGVAYVAEDHVLFSPSAMDALPGAPRYGTLAHRSLDEMLAGARVDVAPYKRDPMDFVLWKPSKPNEPSWPSPAGIAAPGRPGWHIECSAMSMATLLEPFGGGLECDDPNRNVFDIHGGGIDLVFPHHENEIAQSCCAFGSQRMANIWMHNGFLQVEGEKMAKSLGNFVTIHELLQRRSSAAANGPAKYLRLAMLRTHYRQPIDWTVKALEEAEATSTNGTTPSAMVERPSGVRDRECPGRADRRPEYARGASSRCTSSQERILAVAGLGVSRLQRRSDSAPDLQASQRNFLGPAAQTRSNGGRRARDRPVDPERSTTIARRKAARAREKLGGIGPVAR